MHALQHLIPLAPVDVTLQEEVEGLVEEHVFINWPDDGSSMFDDVSLTNCKNSTDVHRMIRTLTRSA